MAEVVKCDICNKVFNKSYVASHKRLAHRQQVAATHAASEPETIEVIASLVDCLSDEGKRKVIERVSKGVPDANKTSEQVGEN